MPLVDVTAILCGDPAAADRRIKARVHIPEPTPLGDVEGGCQWLHGEATDRLFCGHPREQLSSYCTHHRQRCWQVNSSWLDQKNKRAA